jgi:hypothetical protein
MKTFQQYILEHLYKNRDQVNRLLLEWSFTCSNVLTRRDSQKSFVDLVTEELIVQLMPILGMELNRPWTTKSVLQEIARAEMSDLYEREISSLKSQIDDLNDRITEKDLMIDNLSPKIKTSWLGSKT